MSKQFLRLILTFEVLFIFGLVPLGRSLQRMLGSFEGSLFFASSGVILLVGLISFYRALSGRGATRNFCMVHFASLVLLSLFVSFLMVAQVELMHIVLYSTLMVTASLYWRKQGIFYAVSLCMTVSLSDEFLQHLHPERIADFHDLALNACGTLLGFLFVFPFRLYKHHKSLPACHTKL